MRSIGVIPKDYQLACNKFGITICKYPVLEMAAPEDINKFDSEVVQIILESLLIKQENVIIHCRGGIGRAGVLACCVIGAIF